MGEYTITYVDLFAGVGGLSLGFEKEGFENLFSIDFDRDACKTYRMNFPDNALLEKDIKDLTEKENPGSGRVQGSRCHHRRNAMPGVFRSRAALEENSSTTHETICSKNLRGSLKF